ncbi:UDP-N-acetylglucosamine-N-acetylmuramylpentapeptide N-acetylglucosamine transferase [Roseibium hamelinense]|uniref:UDP-N-acetylglucosamine--N-acetylmuramyl-(pentapeptide) pyrophosphoryl-undecaprenol N-acetylglucosamine transferase n=1 Tax=Roseibium hamelinense TaxID=150831 RepID=A0A562TBJ8_9HYPH|nr:undecaprenyldiphospho-muramoylpentapeptide beta-N-acetylglucosaminyltransferase [Roseibium hamelinense]MTI45428.1 undecaprenyldiphospho-muramoylpentapeptide beta-N-acetylglucosaminyltransferase [Roseibium hamelinense]TWI90200.1 UDP-N-acetylglucosamine-N-acetylmuramylpentapeptide N-acetylglucosamine transferase [Roseibium hamelinense]
MSKKVLLTAGGTGGHLFPAQALAGELLKRGWVVELATDERADKYGSSFPASKTHIISSATVRGKNPVSLAKTAIALIKGYLQSRKVLNSFRPDIVVGFGGYPTFPPMYAAKAARIPTVLHEANGVMGRANKMLARGATAIATSFPLDGVDAQLTAKMTETGNPVREAVIASAGQPYSAPESDRPFHLLVFGGSQGARFFSDLLPEALRQTPEAIRKRIKLVQQCRPEDLGRVEAAFKELGVAAELAGFFTDMPERIAASHLIICRSGASSVCELAVLGRPSILVPLPGAIDNDQGVNARFLEKVGGAWPIREIDLTPERLAQEFQRLTDRPEMLALAAERALEAGKPDAVVRLADLVECVSGKDLKIEGDSA